LSRIDRGTLVAEAMLAPSVHNVQPARWRLEGADGLLLCEDRGCRLAVGDPDGNDAGISLGAAAEGLRLAASRHGLAIAKSDEPLPKPSGTLVPIARYRLRGTCIPADPLCPFVDVRRSWRGDFSPVSAQDRRIAVALAGEDAAVVADPALLVEVGRLFDRASYGFMRETDFRRELVSWMRLSPRHSRWAQDGLNAEAMAMSRIEAWGAGLVLGRAFGPLHRLGLAAPLLAEGKKVAGAAALVVFHRPAGETPFESGAHFYRLWLRIEAAGFGGAVLAALADDADAALRIALLADVPRGHRVVSAFRIGKRPAVNAAPRARRELSEVLV
jgi:hypothetical protein